LRVLQEGEFTTVGGRTPIRADVRIVAATNRNLRHMVRQGLFREDLFYRLNVVPIRMPPLRERTEDIPALVRHFLARAERDGLAPKVLDQGALEQLKAYPWPGNVRELESLVLRLTALHAEETITADVIRSDLAMAASSLPEDGRAGQDSLGAAVERHLARYFAAHEDGLPPEGLHERMVSEVERPLVAMCLAATHGNQVRAAKLLGLNRNTLRKKIRELNVSVQRGVR
jgi:two-component system nitrogen regulation response regulator GlnG